MKKLFVLFFVVLVGISLVSLSRADEARTIPKLHGAARGANTVIVSHGGTLYSVMGYASSANAVYSVHDASSKGIAGTTTQGTVANVLAEGGEASQYDSFPNIDFGSEGLPFTYGLIIMTTTADVVVTYN